MDLTALRKPRHYFDTAPRPGHVTFDDGKKLRRNFPWLHYVEARWEYAEPEAIKIFIGDLLVLIVGHNLASLYAAIEDQTLTRIRAQPDLAQDREHAPDSFATGIQFLKLAAVHAKSGQIDLELNLD